MKTQTQLYNLYNKGMISRHLDKQVQIFFKYEANLNSLN